MGAGDTGLVVTGIMQRQMLRWNCDRSDDKGDNHKNGNSTGDREVQGAHIDNGNELVWHN